MCPPAGTNIPRGGRQKGQFLPFDEALGYVRSLKLNGVKAWNTWCKRGGERPNTIPAAPHRIYKDDGWQGMGHWLGNRPVKPRGVSAQKGRGSKFLPFAEAAAFARLLHLKDQEEWKNWRKSGERPRNIPSNPDNIYQGDGWQGYGHWLGTGNIAGRNSAKRASQGNPDLDVATLCCCLNHAAQSIP